MDVVLLVVIAGCALAGLWWGALRMLSALLAVAAAVAAGRWVAPAAASVVAGAAPPGPGLRVGAIVVTVALTAVLVLVAARGLRKGLDALRLGWLDRLAGLAVAGGLGALLLSVLLALAAVGGRPLTTPVAVFLSAAGQTLLATHTVPMSRTSPSTTPASPTSKGQQPS